MKPLWIFSTLILVLMLPAFAGAGMMIPLAQTTCQKDYLELFSKDEINVAVIFGYDDVSDGKTRDIESHNLFVKTLMAPCSSWDMKMCGFKKQSLNPTVLTRRFFGPDGKIKLIKITSDQSSQTDSDSLNRTLPAQVKRSGYVQKLFGKALKNAEVVIYNGHSRDGGGPSFSPPVLKDDGHINYSYYHKNKDDKNYMIEALKENPNKSRIVALVSCSSLRWFQKSVESSAPATGFIGADELFYTVYFQQSYSLLEAIFSYKCLSSIKVDDARKFSKITSKKDLKISAKDKSLIKKDIDQMTLENLGKSLRSNDINVRKEAYLEIKSYDPKLYSKNVREAIKSYTFGNTVKNNL